MKILIVNKFLHPNGGSETYIFEIGKCLESMGHEVQFFGMEHKERRVGNRIGEYTPNMDFHSKASKLTYPFRIIHSRDAARRITRVLEDFKPDVVHFNNINFQLTPSVIEAVADYDIRYLHTTRMVYTAHDSQWVCPNHLLMKPDGTRCFECRGCRYTACIKNRCIHGSLLRSILGAYEAYYYHRRKTYEMIDTIIAPSRFMKETLESDPILEGKCTVLHNFIPDHKGGGTDGPITLPKRYVLYLGRYSEEKGINTLLAAARSLSDIRFVCAGSGPGEESVGALANVTDVGFTGGDTLATLIKQADFSVFSSICHENCSFTVMESLSYGTPVVASATGGTPELVSDGINGLLFEVGDTSNLTAYIRNLWDDPDRIKKLAHGCGDSRFMNVREYCEKLIDIYNVT